VAGRPAQSDRPNPPIRPSAGTIASRDRLLRRGPQPARRPEFRPDDVDDATVARILTAATHAPSAENSQPFVFIVVRDPAIRSTIGAITARVWEGGARDLETGRLARLPARRGPGRHGGRGQRSVLIVVCGDTRLTFAQTLDSSVFPAVQNLLLAAHALGLGSTLTTLPVLGGDELSELLGLPPRWCRSPWSPSGT
jgi:nitroreductase